MAPPLIFETRFDAPVGYAFAWLTDFRPEDMRLGDPKAPLIRVRREGNKITREFEMMGMKFHNVTTIESTTRWTTESEILSGAGKILAVGHVVETIAPAGEAASHRAEVAQEPRSLRMRLIQPMMRSQQRKNLTTLFANAKREMEAQFKSGKPPTA